MVGYSGTPLAKKLGIKAGSQLLLVGAPDEYFALLEPLPEGFSSAHNFRKPPTSSRSSLFKEPSLNNCSHATAPSSNQPGWSGYRGQRSPPRCQPISPKISFAKSRFQWAMSISRSARSIEVWSGLKLVIRKELR